MRKFLVLIWLFSASGALAETKVVIALGDSLTRGFGLREADGFVPQMQAWLQARGHDVHIINAGVSGDTTAGGLARLDWALGPEVQGVIVALGGNDVLRGLPHENARHNLQEIAGGVAQRGLPLMIVGIEAPSNFGSDYKEAFDAIFSELAISNDAVYYRDFIGALRNLGIDEGLQYMQDDRIHPNADGVRLIVEDMGPAVEMLLDRIE